MKFKNILFCAAAILFATNAAFSQQDSLSRATPQQKSEAIAFRMERELLLTKKQTEQIIPLLKKRFESMNSIKGDKSQSMKKINEQSKTSLTAILTKEQYARYEELRLETKKQKDAYIKKHPDYTFSEEDKELDF